MYLKIQAQYQAPVYTLLGTEKKKKNRLTGHTLPIVPKIIRSPCSTMF